MDSKSVGKEEVIIKTSIFEASKIDRKNNQIDSNFCIICHKKDNENQLLLCPICKYNLTHLKCSDNKGNLISEFVCKNCKNLLEKEI